MISPSSVKKLTLDANQWIGLVLLCCTNHQCLHMVADISTVQVQVYSLSMISNNSQVQVPGTQSLHKSHLAICNFHFFIFSIHISILLSLFYNIKYNCQRSVNPISGKSFFRKNENNLVDFSKIRRIMSRLLKN